MGKRYLDGKEQQIPLTAQRIWKSLRVIGRFLRPYPNGNRV
jgi:hypothetical protein